VPSLKPSDMKQVVSFLLAIRCSRLLLNISFVHIDYWFVCWYFLQCLKNVWLYSNHIIIESSWTKSL
jgi:hypothetical protein